LDEAHIVAGRNGPVVGEGTAARRIEPGPIIVAGRPAGDWRIAADIAREDGEGVGLEARVGDGLAMEHLGEQRGDGDGDGSDALAETMRRHDGAFHTVIRLLMSWSC